VIEPRVATKVFFEAAVKAISNVAQDPIMKAQVFDSLHSELNSGKAMFAPKKFIYDYVPEELRKAFTDELKAQKISFEQFTKDTSEIANRLRRRVYETERGAQITVSEDSADLIEIKETKVIVNDAVKKIS
jgi:hypothetical protein